MSPRKMSKVNLELLDRFGSQLRRFFRFCEHVTSLNGFTPLRYRLVLQVKAVPRGEWEIRAKWIERLKAKQQGVVVPISRREDSGLIRCNVGGGDQGPVEVRLTKVGEQRSKQLARLPRNELFSVKDGFAVAGIGGRTP